MTHWLNFLEQEIEHGAKKKKKQRKKKKKRDALRLQATVKMRGHGKIKVQIEKRQILGAGSRLQTHTKHLAIIFNNNVLAKPEVKFCI